MFLSMRFFFISDFKYLIAIQFFLAWNYFLCRRSKTAARPLIRSDTSLLDLCREEQNITIIETGRKTKRTEFISKKSTYLLMYQGILDMSGQAAKLTLQSNFDLMWTKSVPKAEIFIWLSDVTRRIISKFLKGHNV